MQKSPNTRSAEAPWADRRAPSKTIRPLQPRHLSGRACPLSARSRFAAARPAAAAGWGSAGSFFGHVT